MIWSKNQTFIPKVFILCNWLTGFVVAAVIIVCVCVCVCVCVLSGSLYIYIETVVL